MGIRSGERGAARDFRQTLARYEEQAEVHRQAVETAQRLGAEAGAYQVELKDWYGREAEKLRQKLAKRGLWQAEASEVEQLATEWHSDTGQLLVAEPVSQSCADYSSSGPASPFRWKLHQSQGAQVVRQGPPLEIAGHRTRLSSRHPVSMPEAQLLPLLQ